MGGVLAAHQTYCERVVGLSGGGMALLANGRVRSTCSYNYVVYSKLKGVGCLLIP